MTNWYSSDIHFGHANILKYTDRGETFDTVDEMNAEFVENFSCIESGDNLLIDGDAVMGDRAFNLRFFDWISGRKTLIKGNHDNNHPLNGEKKVEKFEPIYAQFFDEMHLELDAEIGGFLVKFTHFPIIGDSHDEPRHDNWRVKDDGKTVIIHGHTHAKEIFSDHPRQIHIGIDSDWRAYEVPRYHPIPEKALIQAIADLS